MSAQTPPQQAPPPTAPPAAAPQQYYPPRAEQAPGQRNYMTPPGTTAATSTDIASDMHRWGRMAGVFAILAMMTWLLLDTVPSVNPGLAAVKSTFLWPGIVLAILAAIGLIGGFSLQFFAGRRH